MADRRIHAVVALGVGLLVGVVAWRILVATYPADLRTICQAERRSGHSLGRDIAKVSLYVRGNLRTMEGSLLFRALRDMDLSERAESLEREAAAWDIDDCPLVEAYRRLAADAQAREELQELCSMVTFPGLGDLEDAARVAVVEQWIAERAESPIVQKLAQPLLHTPGAERATLLREVSRESEIFSCDLAKLLDSPR